MNAAVSESESSPGRSALSKQVRQFLILIFSPQLLGFFPKRPARWHSVFRVAPSVKGCQESLIH